MFAGWEVNPLVFAGVVDVPEFCCGVVDGVAVVGVRSSGGGGADEGVDGYFGQQDAAVGWDCDDPDEVVAAASGSTLTN